MDAIPEKKRRFRIVKLEERITPDLTLPSGGVVFEAFDNPSPELYHPNFYRSGAAIDATAATAGFGFTFNPVHHPEDISQSKAA